MYELLKEAKIKYLKAQQMKAGVDSARQNYINLLFLHELDILNAFEKIQSLEKEISDLKEENELLNKTLEEQDKQLAKNGRSKA